VHEDETVGRRNVMEGGGLLVAEEDVWNPDLLPAIVTKFQLSAVVIALGVECQPAVIPLLAQVHAQRKILHTRWAGVTVAPKETKPAVLPVAVLP